MKISHCVSLLSLALAAAQVATGSSAAACTWSYSYNSLGLVESADASDITTSAYAYDAQGLLATVTNALGHVTQLSNFDTYGNPQTGWTPVA